MSSISETIDKIADLISNSDKVMIFTGAGQSVPSGVPDFRSPGGLWEKYDPYEVSTIQAFRKKPEMVWEFFRDMYANFGDVQPNPAHFAVTEIQQLEGEDKIFISTQNIDGLHTKAGSKNVFEVHGTAELIHCLKCGFEEELDSDKHLTILPYPKCPDCGKPLKPKVVLFEELLDYNIFSEAKKIAHESGIVIGAGTSLGVFPAADILLSPPPKTKKALFNLTPTYYDHLIHYRVKGDVVDTLPELVKVLKAKK